MLEKFLESLKSSSATLAGSEAEAEDAEDAEDALASTEAEQRAVAETALAAVRICGAIQARIASRKRGESCRFIELERIILLDEENSS